MSTTSAKTVFSAKGSDASVVETEWTESGLTIDEDGLHLAHRK